MILFNSKATEDYKKHFKKALNKFLKKGGEIKKVKITDEFVRERMKPKPRKKR